MRYLPDTRVLLWWRADNPRLPHRCSPILGVAGGHDTFFSAATLWELAIERVLGKLSLEVDNSDFRQLLQEGRLLTAQTIDNRATAMTNDRNCERYRCKVQR